MKHKLFIIKNAGKYQGPILDFEAEYFVKGLEGGAEIVPLLVPRLPTKGPVRGNST